MITLHDTLEFAHEMHKGVSDWAGLPYITHPIWVMLHLPATCSEDDRHIALMHDVFEDCQKRMVEKFDLPAVWSPDDFRMSNPDIMFPVMQTLGYSDYVVQGLKLLTRDLWPDLTYLKYVQNIISSGHQGAMWVKYTDNLHNSNSLRTSMLPPERQERSAQMLTRYEKSKRLLRASLDIKE